MQKRKESAKGTETSNITKQIPIDQIFETEFKASNTLPEQQAHVIKKYEDYVTGLMNSITVWIGLDDAAKADKQKLADAVRKVDEKELFLYMADVFYKDFKASYYVDKLLVTSIEDNKFNCYSSTVLFADVLARMGKEIRIFIPKHHVLIVGEKFGFETTRDMSELSATEIADLENELEIPEGDRGAIGRFVESLINNANLPSETREQITNLPDDGTISDILVKLTKEVEKGNLYPSRVSLRSTYPDGHEAGTESLLAIAYAWGGMVFVRQGRNEEALVVCDKALEIDPKLFTGYIKKAHALENLGRFEEQFATFDKALEEVPAAEEDILFYKSMVLRKLDRAGDMLPTYEKILKRHPKNVAVWVKKCVLLEKLDRNEEALEACNATLKIIPEDQDILFRKADLLDRLKRKEEAIAVLDQILEIDTKSYIAWTLKARRLAELDRKEEALPAYDKALEINPDNDIVWSMKGHLLVEIGKKQEAVDALTRAMEVQSPKEESDRWLFSEWRYIADLLENDLNKPEEALFAYDKQLEISPNDIYLLRYKCDLLIKLHRPVEVVATCDRMLAIDAKDYKILNKKGDALYRLGRLDEALAAYDKSLEIRESNEIYYLKGVLLKKLKRPEEALAALDNSLKDGRWDKKVMLEKSNVLKDLGRYKESLEVWKLWKRMSNPKKRAGDIRPSQKAN
jgi:tetratricopeptide (TPR) repeat protein